MARRRKRANGEGTVCQRKDGRWGGAATFGRDRNGKPIRLAVYGRTEQEAREKLDALRTEAAAGVMLAW